MLTDPKNEDNCYRHGITSISCCDTSLGIYQMRMDIVLRKAHPEHESESYYISSRTSIQIEIGERSVY